MRVLYGKVFGLGNAVMAVPTIKELYWLGYHVDVLIGGTPDDVGAKEVMQFLVDMGFVKNLFVDVVTQQQEYDVAIMAIPFDGRWRNGIHYKARFVLDGRSRPDPSTIGLSSWKKHEVDYQYENIKKVFELANDTDEINLNIIKSIDAGQRTSCGFDDDIDARNLDKDVVYLGMGYKKDHDGLWKIKHWGNENYVALVEALHDTYGDSVEIVTSGDAADYEQTILPVVRKTGGKLKMLNYPEIGLLRDSIKHVGSCDMYVGNDTGMMHVAAAYGLFVVGLFFMENSIVKNRPWPDSYFKNSVKCIDGSKGINICVEDVMRRIDEFNGVSRWTRENDQ